ncbi:MAG: type I-E CRISPR-associated protein Cse2/CasB [Geminicoccaceae bacterium]|nr:type I-E CRISPR-associated protein Cse2/CasB [Geminicoccaceae bacterium]
MSEQEGTIGDRIAEAARRWWQAHRPEGRGERRGDPSAFARLRRAAQTVDALAEPAAVALWRMLPEAWRERGDREEKLARTAALAHVLAFVREDDPSAHPMRRLGPQQAGKPETAKLKPMRLRQLLAAREPDELAQAFRRLVALADRRIDVGELAIALLLWSDPVRTRWAFTWHDAGWASPGGAEIPAEAA